MQDKINNKGGGVEDPTTPKKPTCQVCEVRPPKSLLQTQTGNFCVCQKCSDAIIDALVELTKFPKSEGTC